MMRAVVVALLLAIAGAAFAQSSEIAKPDPPSNVLPAPVYVVVVPPVVKLVTSSTSFPSLPCRTLTPP